MFALEIIFSDQPYDVETLFVRRHKAVIGASESAHVEIQDMHDLNYDLRVTRDLARRFRVTPIAKAKNVSLPSVIEGVYDGQAFLSLGKIKINITALDSDLLLKDSEPPDRAGVRIMRLSGATSSPVYPALVVLGAEPVVFSFTPDTPIHIGSANSCILRLDSNEVSPRHARIGFESGQFWVEDIGSNQGTFVSGTQISGRVNLQGGLPIGIGRSSQIVGVVNEAQLQNAVKMQTGRELPVVAEERRYPVLISISEVARPARLVMPIDATVNVGRDPSSDIWLGAPHVSRHHSAFTLKKNGQVAISDFSKNGTVYDGGVLKRGDLVKVQDRAQVFDFGGGLTLALCFSEEQERKFISSAGDPNTFRDTDSQSPAYAQPAVTRSRAIRSTSLPQAGGINNRFKEFVNKLILFYFSLSFSNKIVLCITLAAVITVLIVLFNLIIRLNF